MQGPIAGLPVLTAEYQCFSSTLAKASRPHQPPFGPVEIGSVRASDTGAVKYE